MTSSMVEIDSDVLSVLDFEYAPSCEFFFSGSEPVCDSTAEWKIVYSCCGVTYLLCTQHCEYMKGYFAQRQCNHTFQFGGCGAENIHLSLVERI